MNIKTFHICNSNKRIRGSLCVVCRKQISLRKCAFLRISSLLFCFVFCFLFCPAKILVPSRHGLRYKLKLAGRRKMSNY